MTIPFYTLEIHQPLQQILYDADNNGNWEKLIEYCEPLLTEEADEVILCYTFGIMNQAMQIHVDDVASIGNTCLALLKKLKHTYGGTDHWKRMIKRLIKESKLVKDKENSLSKKPYETLTEKEKAKWAYNLAEKGGVENCRLAAEAHLDLIELRKDKDSEPYHMGMYIINLYASEQNELADKRLADFVKWIQHAVFQSYAFLVGRCYQSKIMFYKDDKEKFKQIWQEAMQNESVQKHDAFPFAYDVQDELIVKAHEYALHEVKEYLGKLIIAERKPRLIPEQVKKILGI
jgi:hypothetical protein